MPLPLRVLVPTAAVALYAGAAVAQPSGFIVRDIRVEGLERVSKGALFAHLPIDVGERFTPDLTPRLIQSLYASGFFDDIRIGHDGDVLVIRVKERPAIADITIEGNKDIETEQLQEALKQAGIAKGRVFNRSVLAELKRELRQQYFARGKYNVRIETRVTELEGNRVAIGIDISEGVVTRIRRVNIIGNRAFSDEELMKDFASGRPAWWAFFSRRDEYAKAKLAGDLEKLRAFYLDRGYLNFDIVSTQVTITPDKKDIYITINVHEGEPYTVNEVALRGDMVVPREELQKLLEFKAGETFSRARVIASTQAIKDRLGEDGYAFARVDIVPQLDEAGHRVKVALVVRPGQRVYVRRITFHGNTKTRDEVLRREMRQLEGAWFSTPAVKRSRERIQRLPFIETVNVERRRVPGSPDLVDLDITVTERLAGSFTIGAGYSQAQGFLFNFSLQQDNAFGAGKRLAVDFNNSRVNTVYSLSYTNPYYTIDGVSRGFSAFYRETNAGNFSVADYLADRWGLGVNYGIPLTEYDRFGFNVGYEHTRIRTTDNTPQEIHDYLGANGDEYGLFLLRTGFTHDTRDRTVFATRGNLQRFNLEASVPGSELEYYKASYRNVLLVPLAEWLTLSLRGDVAYGDAYGETSDLPFFEKYYAGGIRSVRGYRANSLGPRSSTGDPFGGNFRVLGSAELFFPAPFARDNRSVRMGAFVDAGNVFAQPDDFDSGELRLGAGISFEWLSPVGPLTFSLAQALNDEDGDEPQIFQFSIGGSF